MAGADVFVGLTSGGIGATGAGIGDLFHSAAASPVSQLYSHVFRDSGDNPNPDLPEPVRTTYTGWYGGGTAVASVPSRLVPGGIIPLDSWGWAYVPNVLGD